MTDSPTQRPTPRQILTLRNLWYPRQNWHHPFCPPQHLFCKILLGWSCLTAPQGNSSPYCPHLRELYTLMLFSPSTLSMTLGTRTAPSPVPARKSSACQALARHRKNITKCKGSSSLPKPNEPFGNEAGRRAPVRRAKAVGLHTGAPHGEAAG